MSIEIDDINKTIIVTEMTENIPASSDETTSAVSIRTTKTIVLNQKYGDIHLSHGIVNQQLVI